MSDEMDPSITRVTIILDQPSDWANWLFLRKDTAQRHDLWEYVDPSKETVHTLLEPERPLPASYQAGATLIATLSPAN
jgi:hypothetical protein